MSGNQSSINKFTIETCPEETQSSGEYKKNNSNSTLNPITCKTNASR